MKEFILFMHNDATDPAIADDGGLWGRYIAALRGTGQFDGGSSIGAGLCVKKGLADRPAIADLSGFIRIRASSHDEARKFLAGNPVYEAGGTVEIRELLVEE